jgi:hypothetical protein
MTAGGWLVRIYATDGGETGDEIHGDMRFKVSRGWFQARWDKDGRLLPYNNDRRCDLIPNVIPKLDDKVLVKNRIDSIEYKRHFSHFNNDGHPVCFNNGQTSWTADSSVSTWDELLSVEGGAE